MNFDDILEELPNGLHDASLKGIDVSYERRMAVFMLEVDMSQEGLYDLVQDVRLVAHGLAFLVVDPPDGGYPFHAASTLTIDAGSGQPNTSPLLLPSAAGTALAWIYVREWNSFIRFAAESCTYELTGEPRAATAN